MTKVSVIINNFNYADFVEVAVQSVLGQTYPEIEVIVVDDGSTDRSREILGKYASRVKLILKENGGETSGRNEGFLYATGEIVAFLDADDYWTPDAVARVVAEWRASLTKLQFPLMVVDDHGNRVGPLMPRCPLDSGRVESLLRTTGRYITTPTSGNFYSRAFLQTIFPVPVNEWPQSMDSYAATYAGFNGEIGAIHEPLGFYRVHNSNATRVSMDGVDLKRIHMLIERGLRLKRLIEKIATERGVDHSPGIVVRHWLFLKLELARLKLSTANSALETFICACHLIVSALSARELTPMSKLQLLMWTLATTLLPLQVSRHVMNVGFELAPQNRILRSLRAL